LARLATNFKNAGNGGFFNVFEVPQMENGWKMKYGWSAALLSRAVRAINSEKLITDLSSNSRLSERIAPRAFRFYYLD
jgi:hypothetical protein